VPKFVADSAETTGLKWAAPAGGGKVLQVIQATTSSATSSTSTTFGNSNLTANITPSAATSKVLIMVTIPEVYKDSAQPANGVKLRLARGATGIFQFATDGLYTNDNSNLYNTISASYLDSPSTTSSTTYNVQIASRNATYQVGMIDSGSSVGSIILMEIGA